MTLDQKVIDDVNYCIDALGSFLGVKVVDRPLTWKDSVAGYLGRKKVIRPQIVASEGKTSTHNGKENKISIHDDHIGVGYVYFEEAAHCIGTSLLLQKQAH